MQKGTKEVYMKSKLNLKGSTLVECIAAFAIFSFASLILLSGFLVAGNIVVRSVEQKNTTDNIINALETNKSSGDTLLEKSNLQTISFKLGSVDYTANGYYRNANTGDVKLSEFISDIPSTDENLIPDTDKYVNGSWPKFEDYDSPCDYINIKKGTTFVYEGRYFIAAEDLNIGPIGAIPTSDWWWYSEDCLVEISSRPVIKWNGGTQVQFYSATDGHISKGDKVLYNGNYYVFTISNQTWAEPPDISMVNWVQIT